MKSFTLFGITINLSKKQSAKGSNISIDSQDIEMNKNSSRINENSPNYQKGQADAYRDAMMNLLKLVNKEKNKDI